MKNKKTSKPTTEAKTLGRPSLFSETVLTKILELYGKGLTDEQVSEIIGVHVNTLRRWKDKKETFRWATKEAKMVADELIEASLFKKALGFNYFEEQSTKDGIVALQKYSTPDTKAQIFWLKNRRSQDWKDRVEVVEFSTKTIRLNTGDEETDIDL